MGNSESNESSYSSSSSRSYTSRSSKSISVGRGSTGNLKQTIGEHVSLNQVISEVQLLKRQIENHPVFHWGFFFKVNNIIVCIEYTDSGVMVNLFNAYSNGYIGFAGKTREVFYKNMRDFESSRSTLNQILDKVIALVENHGFTGEGYSVLGRNCQHFCVELAKPFDFNARNANPINIMPSIFGNRNMMPDIFSEIVLKQNDDSIFYELENNLDPRSMTRRTMSLAKMEKYTV